MMADSNWFDDHVSLLSNKPIEKRKKRLSRCYFFASLKMETLAGSSKRAEKRPTGKIDVRRAIYSFRNLLRIAAFLAVRSPTSGDGASDTNILMTEDDGKAGPG